MVLFDSGFLIPYEDGRVAGITGVGLTDKSMFLWCLQRCPAMLVVLPSFLSTTQMLST